MDEEEDYYQRIESLETEKSFLSQQVKDLENALNKQKVFHRKFVADVTEAEEMRIKDFNNETKGLREENKRLKAENRELAKERAFYQAAYNSLAEENRQNNALSQSTLDPVQQKRDTDRTSTDCHPSQFSIKEAPVHSRKKAKSLREVTKLSEKWFQDYKKMKLKATTLTSTNTHLKLKVKKLENFKSKIENKKISQEAHRSELNELKKITVRTNEHIFNAQAMAKLFELSK